MATKRIAYDIIAYPKSKWKKAFEKILKCLGTFLDVSMKVVRWLLIWTCIPGLIVCVYLSKELVESSQKKIVCVEKRLTELEKRIDSIEMNRHFDYIEIENLADKILDTCITDAPRLKKKWRKQ